MNSRERYLATLRGASADFLPRVPILMHFAANYVESDYATFASDYRVLVEANRRCAKDFGFDQLSAISDPYRETHGFGAQIVYVKEGVPRCPNPPLERARDLSMLARPEPLRSERMLDRVNAIRAYHSNAADAYSIMGWVEGPAAEAADLRGVGNFMMDILDDEVFAAELMDRCLETAIAFAQAQTEAGADTIGIGDAVASQVSRDIYERLIQPREKRLVRAIHESTAFVRLHICGNVTHLLSGIADLGVDILDVDHMVNMTSVRRAVGGGVALAGNIDPVSGVLQGTPGSIRATIRATCREVGAPYMVNAGCEIPLGTPVENLKALCEPVTLLP